MNEVSIETIQKRKLNSSLWEALNKCSMFSKWNRKVYRYRMSDEHTINLNVSDIIRDGNDLLPNEQLLDNARCWYESGIYTNDEWEKYFIPAINEAIKRNDRFERCYPGYVIQHKETDLKAIVAYDYALAYRGYDYRSLHIYTLDENGEITGSFAWAHIECFNIVDKDNTRENVKKILEYNTRKRHTPPYCLDQELSHKLYGCSSCLPPINK